MKKIIIVSILLILYFSILYLFMKSGRTCDRKIKTTDLREYCGCFSVSNGIISIKTKEDQKIEFSSNLVFEITEENCSK